MELYIVSIYLKQFFFLVMPIATMNHHTKFQNREIPRKLSFYLIVLKTQVKSAGCMIQIVIHKILKSKLMQQNV